MQHSLTSLLQLTIKEKNSLTDELERLQQFSLEVPNLSDFLLTEHHGASLESTLRRLQVADISILTQQGDSNGIVYKREVRNFGMFV